MPSDRVFKVLNAVHRTIFRGTNGRIGGRGAGMPVLDLITTGRKTGKQRATMLTTPLQDGDRVIVIASRGGDPQHPAWYHNLTANPDVEIIMGGRRRAMRARTATPDERAELWPRVTSAHKNYANYQKRAAREIPLVILEPR